MLYAQIVENKVFAIVKIETDEDHDFYQSNCDMLVEITSHMPCEGDLYENSQFISET